MNETPADDLRLVDVPERLRYEIVSQGDRDPVAFVDYAMRDPATVLLMHTEVRPQLEGRGIGTRTAQLVIDHIRRSGQNPEEIKATIRASLKQVEAIDVEAITRKALASVDHEKIAASVAQAEASIAKAQADIERLEERYNDDDE